MTKEYDIELSLEHQELFRELLIQALIHKKCNCLTCKFARGIAVKVADDNKIPFRKEKQGKVAAKYLKIKVKRKR